MKTLQTTSDTTPLPYSDNTTSSTRSVDTSVSTESNSMSQNGDAPKGDAPKGDAPQSGLWCPNCGAELEARKCKLFCHTAGCGYLVTCSEW